MAKRLNPVAPLIVLVDDEPAILLGCTVMLRQHGFENVHSISDSRDLLPFMAGHDVGVLVLDLQMPYLSGKELLETVGGAYPHVPMIVATAASELETAVECMKRGAFDYLVKPFEAERYIASIRKALEVGALRREVDLLRESLLGVGARDETPFAAIKTQSPLMKPIFAYLEAVGQTRQPVLITGETGVGKELFAQAVHALSGRRGPFVAVNSGGLDDQMFADTLFGHKKGAFTGADHGRDGMLVRAEGGTLFLDEIGDLSPAAQVKLLRLLQEGEFYPLGSDTPLPSTARIVVATNCDLDAAMAAGRFRRDLYYRLCSHRVAIPPLRKRPEDIPFLLEAFLAEASTELGKVKPAYPHELVGLLKNYPFPGNVRELRALVFDAMARHKGGGSLALASFRDALGTTAHLAPGDEAAAPLAGLHPSGHFPTLKEMEEILINAALTRSAGNQRSAAALLGISRQALNQRLGKKTNMKNDAKPTTSR